MEKTVVKATWVYGVAMLALVACLWIGWADFDPNVPQDVVRQGIHEAPRRAVQLLVQFAMPIFLTGFLLAGLFGRLRGRARG